jgi:thiosulfate reductase cytochrome b subunit
VSGQRDISQLGWNKKSCLLVSNCMLRRHWWHSGEPSCLQFSYWLWTSFLKSISWHFFCIFVFLLVILLFKMPLECNAELLFSVLKCRKEVLCLTECLH